MRGVLAKFADLPRAAEEEIRDLGQARRRIAELERQVHASKSEVAAKALDEATIAEAVSAAVARERRVWRRKLEQGRAHFRKMIAVTISVGQAVDKLKVLLENVEDEWATPAMAVETPRTSLNHRPIHVSRPVNHRAASVETLDGPLKLASGERRILTALAQYPEGRSKVQVAVLTGYAAAGGGFNNYLGALRSRSLIEGDGDRLSITEDGIQTLGSWEPLPTGSALIDYWRGRLGKAERLILEALAHEYPDPLTKEEVAAKAGYEANGGGFNNALGRLRTLELVQGRGELRASDNLFDAGTT
jgi:hypothetical protein